MTRTELADMIPAWRPAVTGSPRCPTTFGLAGLVVSH